MKKVCLTICLLVSCCFTSYCQSFYCDVKIKERNVLNVMLNPYNRLFVNGRPFVLTDLKLEVKQFMSTNPNNEPSPELEVKNIASLGDVLTSKGVVDFYCNNDSFDEYMDVIAEIAKAFWELRDELAWKKFHSHFKQLDESQKQAIKTAIPIRVTGFEMINGLGIQIVEDCVDVDDVDINNSFIERYIKKIEK